jgi:hypothetical protein
VADVGLVLDADAVLAYSRGRHGVGELITQAADEGVTVAVPALCLAEAYRRAPGDGYPYLELLTALPHVVVPRVDPGDCLFLGGWAKSLGTLHLSHAVLETASRPVVRLMTSARAEVTAILPAQWPIIDVPADES